MQQLVKPAEYAQMHGLSRQSVYAKIKRGTLPSRKIDGRYYVIVAGDIEKNNEPDIHEDKIERSSLIDEYREIIKSKDETIDILKTSINDLKEANTQITQTLQSEISLLKQAFAEMKAIYMSTNMIAQTTQIGNDVTDVEDISEKENIEKKKKVTTQSEKKRKKQNEEECWLPLGDLIQRKQYSYNKAKQVVKRFKKAFKKGDSRIKKKNGIYFISCYDFYEDILV